MKTRQVNANEIDEMYNQAMTYNFHDLLEFYEEKIKQACAKKDTTEAETH